MSRFRNNQPFVSHAESNAAFTRDEPFPVSSCWNGITVVKADLFQTKGLRFRSKRFDSFECGASECELFSRDLWGLGRNRILMVPSVRTAYVFRTFLQLQNQTTIRKNTSHQGPVDFSKIVPPKKMTCCNLPVGSSTVQWNTACFEEDGWLDHSRRYLGAEVV